MFAKQINQFYSTFLKKHSLKKKNQIIWIFHVAYSITTWRCLYKGTGSDPRTSTCPDVAKYLKNKIKSAFFYGQVEII